jgi:hypothetical protein
LLTNRLYHVSDQTKGLLEKLSSAAKGKAKMIRQRPNLDIEVDVPRLLDWQLLLNKICCGKCDRAIPSYQKVLDLGMDNLTADMDIVQFIRRKRMHGFGLHFLLNKKFRSLSARLAFSRPLKYSNEY